VNRTATLDRATSESKVHVEVDLDGTGRHEIATGVGFYDHMLTAFARHALVDLVVQTEGDVHIDAHHTVEDTAIALGQALRQALGDKTGVRRFGDATVPLDEALVQAVVDISGRPFAAVDLTFIGERIGEAPTEMVAHVLRSFATAAQITLHVRMLAGANDHHIAEATMKVLGRALDAATALDPRIAGTIPSTKGTLTT
jgi:imidazoleglycerol-phosphate dehydratase